MFLSDKFDMILSKYKNESFSHAYMFNTNNLDFLKKDLNVLLKNILCMKTYNESCKEDCNICHLFNSNSLPNYIDVYPDGLQIKKEDVENIKEKFNKKTLYGKYNIYVINNCDLLNDKSSNGLLKFLEEPVDNVLGFLITDNIERVLPTIRSRCEIVNVLYNTTQEISENYQRSIEDFMFYISDVNKNVSLVYDVVFKDTSYNRRDFCNIIKILIEQLQESIVDNNIAYLNNISIGKKIDMMDLLKNTLTKLESNVNIEVAILVIALELRKLYE